MSTPGDSSDEAVFDSGTIQRIRPKDKHYFLKSPPEIFATSLPDLRIPQPNKEVRDTYRDSYLQRPLPGLPMAGAGFVARRTSTASVASVTPSLTPSLKLCIDESVFDDEGVELGVAQVVWLPRIDSASSTHSVYGSTSERLADYSVSDYEGSLASTADSCSERVLSPGNYHPTTGNSFEQYLELYTPKRPSDLSSAAGSRPLGLQTSCFSEQDLSRVTNIKLNESEWMSRTPSPIQREEIVTGSRKWSPIHDRMAAVSLFSGLRKKINTSTQKLSDQTTPRSTLYGNDLATASKASSDDYIHRRTGNWI